MSEVILSDEPLGSSSPAFSQAALANGFIFVSGQVSLGKDNNIVFPDDVRKQTSVAMERVRSILGAHGGSMNNIVSATVYLTDRSNFVAFNNEWLAVFGESPPARTTVISELALDGLLVEIQVVAAV